MNCPYCLEDIDRNSARCEFCGSTIHVQTQQNTPLDKAIKAESETLVAQDENQGVSGFGIVFKILGFLAYAFAVIDFAGMFFKYDITGVSWSPIVAGLAGSFLFSMGGKEDEESK